MFVEATTIKKLRYWKLLVSDLEPNLKRPKKKFEQELKICERNETKIPHWPSELNLMNNEAEKVWLSTGKSN
jgi:hypothetical protein